MNKKLDVKILCSSDELAEKKLEQIFSFVFYLNNTKKHGEQKKSNQKNQGS